MIGKDGFLHCPPYAALVALCSIRLALLFRAAGPDLSKLGFIEGSEVEKFALEFIKEAKKLLP